MGLFTVMQLAVTGYDSNFSYLIHADNGDAAVVDPCGDTELIRKAVLSFSVCIPRYILITHSHPDHISGLAEVRQFFPAPPMTGGEILPFGGSGITAIHTPGHSQDSICWKLNDNSAVFTGDTLFTDDIGFCHPKRMFESLKKLKALPDSTVVYPGHDYGQVPFDTIGNLKQRNPYLAAETYERFHELWKHLE